MTLRTGLFWVLSILATPGCFGDEAAPPAPPPTEDAGSIVLAEPLSLDSAPLFLVGGAKDQEPGHNLHRIPDALLLEDGGLIVANRASSSLHRFDAQGRFAGEIGRAGEGPGEFGLIRWIFRWEQDAIAIWDVGLGRVSVLGMDGEVRATIPIRTATGNAPEVMQTQEILPVADSALVAISSALVRNSFLGPTGFVQDTHYVALLDRAGAQVDTLGVVPGMRHFRDQGTSMAAVNGDRFMFATTSEALYLASGRGPTLTRFAPGSSTGEVVRLPIERAWMSPELWQDLKRRYMDLVSDSEREFFGSLAERSVVVDSFPAYTDLVAGSDDRLWLKLWAPSGDPVEWLVVDFEAGVARPLTLPYGSSVLHATTDRVALLREDDLDRQEVAVYRIGY